MEVRRNQVLISVAALLALQSFPTHGCPADQYQGAFGWCYSKIGGDVGRASEAVKKGVDHLGVEINKEAIKIGEKIDENKEVVAAVAIIAVVGWAACIDGCAMIGSLLAGGAALPVLHHDKNTSLPTASNSAPSVPKPSKINSLGAGEAGRTKDEGTSTYRPKLIQVYPAGFSRARHPDGAPLKLVYRSPRDDLGSVFNEFAFPTRQAVLRYPGDRGDADAAGGLLESPRNEISAALRHRYGVETRRVHGGIDFLTFPGEEVRAPMSGVIETVQAMSNKNGLQMVTIRAADGTLARVLYVQPAKDLIGDKVLAGQTVIGKAQNIGAAYDASTTPNHIHIDYTDHQNRRFDPWSNKVVEKGGL